MSHITQIIARKLFPLAAVGCLFTAGLAVTPVYAGDDWNGERRYTYTHDRDNRPVCRPVIKKFQVNRNLTYTERGAACRDPWGNWNMMTKTRYPNYIGEVYVRDEGLSIYIGNLFPERGRHNFRPTYVSDWDWDDHWDRKHDRKWDRDRHDERNCKDKHHNHGRGRDRHDHDDDDRGHGHHR